MVGQTLTKQLIIKGIHSYINAGLSLTTKDQSLIVPRCPHRNWASPKNVFLLWKSFCLIWMHSPQILSIIFNVSEDRYKITGKKKKCPSKNLVKLVKENNVSRKQWGFFSNISNPKKFYSSFSIGCYKHFGQPNTHLRVCVCVCVCVSVCIKMFVLPRIIS